MRIHRELKEPSAEVSRMWHLPKRIARVVTFTPRRRFCLPWTTTTIHRWSSTSLRNHTPSATIRSKFIFRMLPFFLLMTVLIYSCGPIFGAGADLLISNNCNVNMESYSNFPHSYDGPNAVFGNLFGEYNFSIADYEVFTLAPSAAPSGMKMKHDRYPWNDDWLQCCYR